MSFPPALLDEIRARLSCSEVVGTNVGLVKKGREYHGLCPFHNEKTSSFTVNDEKRFFHCFGCGAHGDIIDFVQRVENITFLEAVQSLAAKANIVLDDPTRMREDALARHYAALEAACAWFESQLQSPAGHAALAYLRGRGLSDATIRDFRLGYAPASRDALKRILRRAGHDETVLLETSLLAQSERGRSSFDFFRGRVIFPIRDAKGRVIAFGGRVLGDGQPKYLNSRDTPLFDKGRTLYALDAARTGLRSGAELVVAEGYMDVIALHQAGFAGAVAPLGTALTEAQLELLWRLAPEPILCMDGDAAGQRAGARAAARALPLLRPGLSLRFAPLPGGLDPDDILRTQGSDGFARCLAAAEPLAEIVWRSETASAALDTPERRAGLIDRLTRRIRTIGDRRVRDQYLWMFVHERLAGHGAAGLLRRSTSHTGGWSASVARDVPASS